MSDEMATCPHCGALRNPTADRCWQCKEYLHGTKLEGRLLRYLPAGLAHAPGTAVAIIFIFAYYLLMVVLSGPSNVLGFSSYTLQQLGALHGPSLLLGEHWRYLTYMFSHADLVHLAFNVAALNAVGPQVEGLYDKKKMFLMFVASGVGGGLLSLVWYVFIKGGVNVAFVSPGASGAVSGMIGAALFGARRLGFDGRALAQDMQRWAIYMVIWGVAMSGVNNAAHLGGFLAGAGLARSFSMGTSSSLVWQKLLSVISLAVLGLILFSTGLMLQQMTRFPVTLQNDAQSRNILMITYKRGADWESSSQLGIFEACARPVGNVDPAEHLYTCELNVRVNDHEPTSYLLLAQLLMERGEVERASQILGIVDRIGVKLKGDQEQGL